LFSLVDHFLAGLAAGGGFIFDTVTLLFFKFHKPVTLSMGHAHDTEE
jgi:hypothetical protein